MTDTAAVTALVDGSKVSFQVLATSMYAREGDGWRSVFHQQTEV